MTDKTLIDELDDAMKVLSTLSTTAKSAGNNSLMYGANRAWHELFNVRHTVQPARAQPEKR